MKVESLRLVSRGARHLAAGDVDGAIRLFQAALAVDDRADTHRYLGMAFAAKRDVETALAEIDAAIVLRPNAPENHHLRSLLCQVQGDYVQAAIEHGRSVQLDSHYRRIAATRRAISGIRTAVPAAGSVEWARAVHTEDPELRTICGALLESATLVRKCFDRPACDLPCPACCCYFEHDLFEYGVVWDDAQVEPVRAWLASRGLAEEAYIGTTRAAIPPDGGPRPVHYPRRSGRRVDPSLLATMPLNLDCGKVVWTSEHATACMFLGSQGCLIHRVGERPGPDACRAFMCLTGLAFLALRSLGLRTDHMVRGRGIASLNGWAPAIVIAVYERVYGNADLTTLESSLRAEVQRAAEAEHGGHHAEAASGLAACRVLDRQWRASREAALQALSSDVDAVLRQDLEVVS